MSATTAICIRVKRYAETFFILCDEYETVENLKGRMLTAFNKIGFTQPKQEEPLTTDDIRLCIKNRVSFHFNWPLQILDNLSTCHDQQVFNDTLIYVLLKKPGTKDEFEPLEQVAGQEFVYEYPAKKREEVKEP